jgi:hypothetical protein
LARFNAALLRFLEAHRSAFGEPHPLLASFLDAVDGRFLPADGGVTAVPALPRGLECSVAFTGHAVIATALPAADVRAHVTPANSGPMSASLVMNGA